MNKTALVTGASRGIGRGMALELASRGYNVGLVGTKENILKEVSLECEKRGGKGLILPFNLIERKDVEVLVQTLMEKFGRLDVLINNAGVSRKGLSDDLEIEGLDEILMINLRNIMALTRAALPEMKKQDEGVIVNISSIAGRMTYKGGAQYCATKWGLTGYSGALFEDVRENKIKVCTIYPGFVATEMAIKDSLDIPKMIQIEDMVHTLKYILDMPFSCCPTDIVLRPQCSPYK